MFFPLRPTSAHHQVATASMASIPSAGGAVSAQQVHMRTALLSSSHIPFFSLKGQRRTSMPELRDNCGFRDIVLTNQYLVTAPDQVRLREHLLSSQPGRKILDMRDWTRVWDGGAVEKAEVATRPVACLIWAPRAGEKPKLKSKSFICPTCCHIRKHCL